MEKKKLLFVITKSNWGGAQKQVFELATHFKETFEVSVAMGGTGEPGSPPGLLWEKLIAAGIPATHLTHLRHAGRNLGLMEDLRACAELRNLFTRTRPHIVHLHSSKMAAYGAIVARFAQVPKIVATIHGWAFNEDRPLPLKALFYLAHYLGALASTSVIAVNSRDAHIGMSMPFLARKITLIHNGIGAIPFMSRDEARKLLGISPERLVVGSIGELTPNKNYDGLLRGVGLVPVENFTLMIIGEGECMRKLTAQAQEESLRERSIVLKGFIADASLYLRAFDIFVLPSRKEGLPYVLLEAGLAGLSTIATSVGGIPDIVEDGVTGLLVSPTDPRTIADALLKLLGDPELRTRLGTALTAKIETAFSVSAMLRATAACY